MESKDAINMFRENEKNFRIWQKIIEYKKDNVIY